MPYLEITIDIFKEVREPADERFYMALHDLLDQYYPQAYDTHIEFTEG